MKQFTLVNCTRGAPMGRAAWDEAPTVSRSVNVFKVKIDSQGYDDGGAYWGIGKPLFCATNGENYRMFTRADSRLSAIVEFRLAAFLLKNKGSGYARLKELEDKGCISASGVILRQQLDFLGFTK